MKTALLAALALIDAEPPEPLPLPPHEATPQPVVLPAITLADLDRFPSHECVTAWCRFNRDHRSRITDELSLCEDWRRPSLYAMMDEARNLYQPWDLLEDAQAEWRSEECR